MTSSVLALTSTFLFHFPSCLSFLVATIAPLLGIREGREEVLPPSSASRSIEVSNRIRKSGGSMSLLLRFDLRGHLLPLYSYLSWYQGRVCWYIRALVCFPTDRPLVCPWHMAPYSRIDGIQSIILYKTIHLKITSRNINYLSTCLKTSL
jgi:hypothetical protein